MSSASTSSSRGRRTRSMGQYCCLPAETPAHADDAEAQLVEQEGEQGATFAVHRESSVDVHTAAAGKSDAVPPGDTKAAAGTDAAGHASQSKEEAAKATDGTSKSVDRNEHKKGILITGKHKEHQESSSKPKHAVAVDRVSGEHAVGTTTKTADDKPISKKSASTAAVHKATGTQSKNRKDHASKGEAAGEHKKHEDKHDEQRGTPEKAADAAATQQPSSHKKSSTVPPSHAEVRASTGDANAHPAAAHQPGGRETGSNVPASTANSSSPGTAHSASQDEEAQRAARREARTRALVQSTWSRTTAILCLLVVLAVALGSLFFKTAEEKAHLLSLLGSDHFTPSSSNLSEAALLQPENETIFGEPRLDNPVID